MNKMNSSEIRAAIAEIGSSSIALRDKIQTAACAIIMHAMEHGDVTLGTELVLACGKSVDRQALVHYLEDHGPFAWDKKADGFKLNKNFRAENTPAAVMEKLEAPDAKAWYEYGRDTKSLSSKFDVKARILSLVKSAEKAKKEGKEVENPELLAVLDKALKDYNAKVAEALRAAVEADPGKATTPTPTPTEAADTLATQFGGAPTLATGTNG